MNFRFAPLSRAPWRLAPEKFVFLRLAAINRVLLQIGTSKIGFPEICMF